ncbi:MAG: hypothetical protein HUU55_21430, partial [Myxococcales bacterium]|nr:hypothetical protein [Myxococcales bacterium]
MASFYRTLAFGLSYIAVLTLTGCPDDITKKDQNQGNLPTDFESVDASDSAGTEKDAAVNPDVVPETCETNAQCAALVKDSDACLVALCDVTTQKCFVGEKKDLSECDDANACTLFTVCMDGECISPNNQVLACNDANPCTADTCDADSGCVHTPNEGACDDGNPCTVGDTCSLGVCTGEPGGCGCEADLDCAQFDDGNLCNGTMVCENGFCKLAEGSQVVCPASDDPCVTSQCVATTGECVTAPAPEGTACSDGISCTLGDGCTQGKCVAGTDQCPQCVSSAECAEFDDGNACNGAVLCINGKCASLGPVSCPQVGPCLSSKCDPATGQCAQSPAPQGTSCDDFNACTVADTCSNGVCQGGKLKNCDDKNPCTFDECSPKTGTCQHMTAPDCGGMCGDGTCGPQDSCTTCPEDCGFCPDECGDGECTPNEDCLVCPVDCGNCGAECGDGFCGPDENCKSCQKDCGPCGVGNGCEATEGPGCGGCVCEGCVCKLDPYCCDIQWDDLCVSECTNECNGCGVDPGGCGDGQCAPGENCQSCSKDCGPCGSGDGCQANEGPGCGGCACEACVCGMDAFCCDVQWDDLCASECAEECNGCGIVPTGCGNGKCEANENCQTCPKDCGTCPGACGNGKCEANENC